MLFYKLSLGILLFTALNLVSADDDNDENYDDSSSPCIEFAQTCVDLCMEKEHIKSFSSSCGFEASSCKCDGQELASKVIKSLAELYNNIDIKNMKLQVEKQDADIAPIKMLNLILEDDVNYDEIGQDDNYDDEEENEAKDNSNTITKENTNVLEEIRQIEHFYDNNPEEEGVELDGMESEDGIPEYFNLDEAEDSKIQNDSDIFCPIFIQRCKDDCPAASSRSSCIVSESDLGYLLVCDCNGVDISSSVRNQVMAEVFHSSV